MAANMQAPPTAMRGDPIKTGNWKNGFCGCFGNVSLCVVTYVAPCVTFGELAEAHGDNCEVYGCLYLVPFFNWYLEAGYRGRIRQRRGVIGTWCEDFCIILICPFSALQQEVQEIRDIQMEDMQYTVEALDATHALPGDYAPPAISMSDIITRQ